jgi:hypothetical protein
LEVVLTELEDERSGGFFSAGADLSVVRTGAD